MVKFAEAEKRGRGGDGSGGGGGGSGGSNNNGGMMVDRPKMSRIVYEALKEHIISERKRKMEGEMINLYLILIEV